MLLFRARDEKERKKDSVFLSRVGRYMCIYICLLFGTIHIQCIVLYSHRCGWMGKEAWASQLLI